MLFQKDTESYNMYFVSRGRIEYDTISTMQRLSTFKQTLMPPVVVKQLGWLCEQPLWISWTHCGWASVRSRCCELSVVHGSKFQLTMKGEQSVQSYAQVY